MPVCGYRHPGCVGGGNRSLQVERRGLDTISRPSSQLDQGRHEPDDYTGFEIEMGSQAWIKRGGLDALEAEP